MTKKIPQQIVDKIRKENDIVEVVEDFVQLKQQGKNHIGICPFHDEKTPSFSVSKDKQLFHCFGCGKGGSVFTFIMEIEQLTFIEAVEYLANRINLSLPKVSQEPTMSDEGKAVLSAYEWLMKFYHHILKYSDVGEQALQYLTERGISDQTIDKFQLGYAPINSDITVDFLKQKGFALPLLAKNRILTTNDQENYFDVFRGRVIFPINNHVDRVVAFGGRAINNEKPKYLNSPEHEWFQKSSLLYNFSKAKGHIRKRNSAIIFEGYLDVLTADQAGIQNVVATLGTALTKQQAMLLHRYVDTVVICYDGDAAGIEASYEAAQIFREINCDVKIANLNKNIDPDDYIKKYGGEKFKQEVIDGSDTYFKFFMRYKKSKFNMTIDSERIEYIEQLLKELATIDRSIEREIYLKEIADEFQLSEDILLHDMNKYRKSFQRKIRNKTAQKSNTIRNVFNKNDQLLPAYYKAEQLLIRHMINHPHILEKVRDELGVQFNITEHKVILTHLYALYEEKNSIDVSELVDKLNDERLSEIVTKLSITSTIDQVTNEEINDYMHIIRREQNEFAYLRELKQKQKLEKDPILAAKIGLEIVDLERKLKSL